MLKYLCSFVVFIAVFSCSNKTGSAAGAKKNSRDKYAERVKAATSPTNPMLTAWQYAGEYALNYPLSVNSRPSKSRF